jgi:Fe-S cluster assembly scaffold protein SufB
MVNSVTITEDVIEKRGISLHEPRWLREQRKEAWTKFQSAPSIDWKKSKTPVFDVDESLRALDFSETTVSPPMPKFCPKGKAGELILEDGKLFHLSVQQSLAYEGVFFSDLRTAVLERADLVEKYFAKKMMPEDRLALLPHALWSNGYFLYIPEKLEIQEPFEITLRKSHQSSAIVLQNLIIADQEAFVIIEETAESLQDMPSQHIFASTTEIETDERSRVSFHGIRDWKSGIYDLSSFYSCAMRDSVIHSVLVFHGAMAGSIEISGDLGEEGASLEQHGMVLGGDRDQLKISARMQHLAPNTNGFLQFKGGLNDHAYAYLDGQINISPRAKKSSSRLQEHVMLLSPHARSDALPALHIEASQVQVSHSASISKADPEQIFYLMSRGLPEEQSLALIMEGFFDEVLQQAKSPMWVEKARAIVCHSD